MCYPHYAKRQRVKSPVDVSVPRSTSRFVTRDDVTFADQRGWRELTNGNLLSVAESGGFDVMLIADTNPIHQQNLIGRRIALVVLSTNAWPVIRDNLIRWPVPSMPRRRDHTRKLPLRINRSGAVRRRCGNLSSRGYGRCCARAPGREVRQPQRPMERPRSRVIRYKAYPAHHRTCSEEILNISFL